MSVISTLFMGLPLALIIILVIVIAVILFSKK